jgi:hypothetical protein
MRTWLRFAIIATGPFLALAVLGGCTTGGPAGSSSGQAASASPSASSTSSPEPEISVGSSPNPSRSTVPLAGSGVVGKITVDGGCPVMTDPPCPDRPISARITITDTGSGKTVVSMTSGTDGAYRIRLTPGSYQLHAAGTSGGPFPRAVTVPVTVQPGRFVSLNLRLDSGIR